MKLTRTQPGHYIGTLRDGRVIETYKIREGSLYCNDWMWPTYLEGVHLSNAATLAEARAEFAGIEA